MRSKLLLILFALASTLCGVASCASDRSRTTPAVSAMMVAPVEDSHCPLGCPIGENQSHIVEREIYRLSYNVETKFADWVSFTISRETVGSGQDRDWEVDENFEPDERIEESDWTGAFGEIGYERGHLALLTDFTGLPERQWSQTNILSNIAPQCGEFNIGPWGALEDAEKDLARSRTDVVLISVGSIYAQPMPPLPSAELENGQPKPHQVPSGFWKVIAVANGDNIEVAAFEFDQHHLIPDHCKRSNGYSDGRDYCRALVPLTSIEAMTQLDLLPAASASQVRDAKEVETDLLRTLRCPAN